MMISLPVPILFLPVVMAVYGLFSIWKSDKPVEGRVFFASLFVIMLASYAVWFNKVFL